MLDEVEFDRWHATALDALANAEAQVQRGTYNWACFLAEQAAQFAVKALLHGLGQGGWGHDLAELGARVADALDEKLPDDVADGLVRLSRHYIAARYPNAHPGGTPGGHYREADAVQALTDARTVLAHVEATWAAAQTAADEADDDG